MTNQTSIVYKGSPPVHFKYMKVSFTLFMTTYLTIVMFFSIVSYNFFISDYIKLENKQNQHNINMVFSSINLNLSNLKGVTNDYSKWDESYAFIENVSEDYIYENFREGTNTLEGLGADFFIYSNLKQKAIFSQYSNELLKKDKIDFEKEVLRFFKKDNVNTIFKYKSHYFYFIKSEIKKSDQLGAANGYIYSGKLISNKSLNTFTDVFSKVNLSKKNSSINNLEHKLLFQNNAKMTITHTNSKLINKINFFDVDNNYVFSVITENDRDILNNGQKTIVIFNLIIAIFLFVILFILYKNQKILERLVEKKSKEVIEKQKIIAQQTKMIAMAEILENIAHQWRQPLSVITTASSGVKLNSELGLLREDELLKTMDIITNSAVYLSNTINDFRNFQNKNKKTVALCLSKTIEKALSLLDSKLHDENIKVTQNIQGIKILGIENELIQVFLNVFNNSIDAFVEKKIDDKLIIIDMSKQNRDIAICIKDNAGGIHEDIVERIFEPYFTTKHKSQGTGIGLYMSFEIITKHMKGKLLAQNCSFTVDSKKYEGAKMTIKLPMT